MGLVNSSLRSLVVASDLNTRLLILLAWPVNSFFAGSILEARNWDPDGVCWICCEGGKDLLHTGCACRGSAGLAHARCLEQAAVHDVNRWTTCPTCRQQWTGEMEVALARARYERVRHRPADDEERLFVQQNLAVALFESAGDGRRHDPARGGARRTSPRPRQRKPADPRHAQFSLGLLGGRQLRRRAAAERGGGSNHAPHAAPTARRRRMRSAASRRC